LQQNNPVNIAAATVELHRLEWYDGLGAFAIERSRRLAPG
jgi:hypothetical protein